MSSYKTCSVPMCRSTTIKYPDKLFIHVPKCGKRRKQWLQLARRDPKFTSDKSCIFFCEDHFDLPYDMENYIQYSVMGSVGKIRMKPDCLPLKFECQPERITRTAQPQPRSSVSKRRRTGIIQEIVSEDTEIAEALGMTSSSELRVCRGCLATDTRLYDMGDNNLMEPYSALVNTTVQVTDDLPHYLCSYCAVLLLKCDTFRKKCLDAQSSFQNAQCHNLEQTKLKIKHCYPTTHFTKSDIETYSVYESIPPPVENVENIPKSPDTSIFKDIKIEFDADTCDPIDDNTEMKTNTNIKSKPPPIENIEYIPKSTDTSICTNQDIKIEFDADSCDPKDDNTGLKTNSNNKHSVLIKLLNCHKSGKVGKRKHKIETVVSKQALVKIENLKSNIINEYLNNDTTYDNPIDVGSTHDSNSDTEEEMAIADLKVKSKSNITKDKPENKKKKPENLSKMYNMEDVELSREEQLKEIEDRKNSNSYLLAAYKCAVCYKGFLMEETYQSHILSHDETHGKYVCDICHCHFMDSSRLNKHMSNHKKRYTCKECGFITKYLSQAKEHFKWHGGVKDTCKYCGKGYSGQSSYYLHLKVVHPTSDELVRCEMCEESCNGHVGLTLHLKRAHKEMTSLNCYCSGCDTQFYCSDAFKAHQGTDGLCDTLHKYCVRCGMSFETEELLKEHETEQRKPRTSYKCKVCSKNFVGVTSYKKHQRTHSSSLIRTSENNKVRKRAVCEICGKISANKYLLKQHYSNKHSTEAPYQCTICPKSFRNVQYLQIHTRTHTGERPYRCSHCSKAFKTYNNMKRHKLVHSGERAHSCEMCGKAFKTKCDAKTHIKSVHMKIPMPPRIRRRIKKTE